MQITKFLASLAKILALRIKPAAQVPVKGVRTVYSMTGNWFGWLATAGFLIAVIVVVVKARRGRGRQ